MHRNTTTQIKGCITQQKFLRRQTLAELERRLGFHTGRLANGVIVAALTRKPLAHEFEFGGYTQVASHYYQEQYGKVQFDKNMMKKKLINEVFTTLGPDRLVKVMPYLRHNPAIRDDDQYPQGRVCRSGH